MDDLKDRYEEYEDIVDALEDLSNNIKYHKHIMEQIDALRFDIEREMEEEGRRLKVLEDEENREQEFTYNRSRW